MRQDREAASSNPTNSEGPSQFPWSHPSDAVLKNLRVSQDHGLTETEIKKRRKQYGKNHIRKTKTRGTGEAVVCATEMNTQIGTISSLVEEAESKSDPLEKRLNVLTHKLVWAIFIIGAGVGVAGILAGRDLEMMIKTSIALIAAAIPEGLAVVATVALAKGMHRMAQQNAVVRRLSAVQTLGSTNVILTDKTGTLTENKISVKPIRAAHRTDEPIMTRAHWVLTILYGTLLAAAVIGALLIALRVLDMPAEHAVTVSFLCLALGRLWHVFNMRDPDTTILKNQIATNKYIWSALLLCTFLILAAVLVPEFAAILDLTVPGIKGWLTIFGTSLIPLVVGQIGIKISYSFKRH